MATRAQQKQRTRRALLQAALDLAVDGRSVTALGIREVTRRAGVTPAAFYVHFRDLEELTMAVVDDVCLTLRRKMRDVRRATPRPDVAVQGSVADLLAFFKAQRRAVEFVVRERVSGTPRMRAAIAREIDFFTSDLANDLRSLTTLRQLAETDIEMLARTLVTIVIARLADFIELPAKAGRHEKQHAQRLVRELRLVLVGARNWDPSRV